MKKHCNVLLATLTGQRQDNNEMHGGKKYCLAIYEGDKCNSFKVILQSFQVIYHCQYFLPLAFPTMKTDAIVEVKPLK